MKITIQLIFKIVVISYFILKLASTTVSAQGAKVPFITYEAEAGVLNGGASVLSVGVWPTYQTVEVESSGRKCVALDATGESVSWTTTEQTNTIVVRVCLPDAPAGGGISGTLNLYVNGIFRQAISCTSKYAWLYGTNPSMENNDPTLGNEKRFFDCHRAFISGDPVPAGSTIMLKKDADNTAPYYKVDLVFLENVGPPLTQPENTLSVISYGAIPDDDKEDSQAFKDCVVACQTQKKGLWIPSGVFHTRGILTARGINIYGAGMWYTTNYRIIGDRHKWDLYNCNVQDIYFYNPEVGRNLLSGHDSGMTIQGDLGWTVQRVWNHHLHFWCSGSDGIIKDCRSTESYADGINLNNGPSVKPEYAGARLTAMNNYVIGCGDDGFAINSQNSGGIASNMVDTKIINNTSIGVTWANGIRVAGGRNSLIQNNFCHDMADLSGIYVGTFGTAGNPCESVLVKDNYILRGCGVRNIGKGVGGITVADNATATIQNNILIDTPGLGANINDCNVTFTGNEIFNPASHGFLIKAARTGSGTFINNKVAELKSGMSPFKNDSPTTFIASTTDNSWQSANGIEEIDSKSEAFTVFSTPLSFESVLTIHVKDEGLSIFRILNTNGQVVYMKNLNGPITFNLVLNELLKRGIYIAMFTSKESKASKKLIVK